MSEKNEMINKILLHVLGLILGIGAGAFLVFQVLFLAKVLPHGGI